MTHKPLQILVSTYACGPNWGSEVGMGWHWIINLSNHCQLFVLTELGFKNDIEEKLASLDLKFTPQIHYIDVGDKGRKLFWNQGSFRFYKHYRKWQKKAFEIAKSIVQKHPIDVVHQLNMIGFREPGYLWRLTEKPFIWGPVGGFNQIPRSFLLELDLKNIFYYGAKNCLNTFQKYTLKRVQNSVKNADILIGATAEARRQLIRLSGKEVLLMNETGCHLYDYQITRNVDYTGKIKILWVGRLQARKGLNLAIKALSTLSEKIDFEFIIVGNGSDLSVNKKLVKKLGLVKKCTFLGEIDNKEVIQRMRESNFLFFTSLVEGTPHVVTEAIQNGLPVICHEICGQGMVIDKHCGITIPVVDPKTSIDRFSQAILQLSKDPELQKKLSEGALKKAKEVSWNNKALGMVQLYAELLLNKKATINNTTLKENELL